MSIQPVEGLAKLIDRFDVFFIDIYGVIHNGSFVYSGVVDCLAHLALAGKSVLLLTNTPARSQVIVRRLETIGIPPSLYQHLLSSGEVTFKNISQRSDSWYARLGESCYFIGPSHSSLLGDSRLKLVSDINLADFIVVAGPDDWHASVKDYEEDLQFAAEKNLPLICANPNKGSGLKIQAGDIAEFYESLGGEVHFHGKPFPAFYQMALACYPRVHKDKILVIGDSLSVDIQGAISMELISALVTGGLHSYELETTYGRVADEQTVEKLCQHYGVAPNYTLPGLLW